MSSKKKGKIPRKYRKALKEKKLKSLTAMLTDNSERKLVLSCFVQEPSGKYRYSKPEKDADVKKAAAIIRKIHKARSGPRIIRISVLLVLIVAIVVFNLFFLDNLVSDRIEKVLEESSETDVTIDGFDLHLTAGRVDVDKLAFASAENPMVDSLVLAGIAADMDWGSVFFRRLVFDDISASLLLDEPRDTAAVYPRKQDSVDETEKTGGGGFNLGNLGSAASEIADEMIPDETLNYINSLRESAEADIQGWTEDFNLRSNEVESLGDEITAYISKPLPGKTDIQAWTSRIEEGKRLSEKLSAEKDLVEQYRRELLAASREAQTALDDARAAVNADMKQLKDESVFNGEVLNSWIERAVIASAGPRAGKAYGRIAGIVSRFSAGTGNGSTSDDDKNSRGRMKKGRIVSFPVVLPPRFSIRKLNISGEGIELSGENIGIDHDLAGAPSILFLDIDGIPGMEGRISSDITVDLRTGAENPVSGKIDSSGWPFEPGNDFPGGKISSESAFTVRENESGGSPQVISEGHIVLSDWVSAGGSGSEGLSFINASSPPLAFSYSLKADGGNTALKIEIDRNSFEPWKKMLAGSAVSAGIDTLERSLPPEAADDLQALEGVVSEWDDKEALTATLDDELLSYEEELDDVIDEMTSSLPVDVPLPKASSVLGNAGSLFGN